MRVGKNREIDVLLPAGSDGETPGDEVALSFQQGGNEVAPVLDLDQLHAQAVDGAELLEHLALEPALLRIVGPQLVPAVPDGHRDHAQRLPLLDVREVLGGGGGSEQQQRGECLSLHQVPVPCRRWGTAVSAVGKEGAAVYPRPRVPATAARASARGPAAQLRDALWVQD
jgi:hypothetical protein